MSQLPLLPPSAFFTERDCPGVSFSSTEMKAIPSLLTNVVASSTATSPPLEGVGAGAGAGAGAGGSVAGGAPAGGSVAGGAPTGGAVGGAPTGGAVGGAPAIGGRVAGVGG